MVEKLTAILAAGTLASLGTLLTYAACRLFLLFSPFVPTVSQHHCKISSTAEMELLPSLSRLASVFLLFPRPLFSSASQTALSEFTGAFPDVHAVTAAAASNKSNTQPTAPTAGCSAPPCVSDITSAVALELEVPLAQEENTLGRRFPVKVEEADKPASHSQQRLKTAIETLLSSLEGKQHIILLHLNVLNVVQTRPFVAVIATQMRMAFGGE